MSLAASCQDLDNSDLVAGLPHSLLTTALRPVWPDAPEIEVLRRGRWVTDPAHGNHRRRVDMCAITEVRGPVAFRESSRRSAPTNVTWAMRSPMPFVRNVMTLFFDPDNAVSGECEKGLASLEALWEQ